MLSRRYLRIKAMQSIFAFTRKTEANVFRSKDLIDDYFLPNLNSMERPNQKLLNRNKKSALEIFDASYKSKTVAECPNDEVKKCVVQAINYFYKEQDATLKETETQMLKDIESLMGLYFKGLSFFTELIELLENTRSRERRTDYGVRVSSEYSLCSNKLIKKILEHPEYQSYLTQYDIRWEKDNSLVWKIYTDVLLEKPEYKLYIQKENHTWDEDKKIINHIAKKIIYDNDLLISYFEESDIHVDENLEIAKSLLIKTIKLATEEEAISFVTYPENWEEDKEYFIDLFRNGAKPNQEIDTLIKQRLKNWDADRVTTMDMVIIKMAMVEFFHFQSIPVKVSLNEAIELAKSYSTPKSKIFVNGVLDALINDLNKEDRIKKSGRGLMDNK